MKTIPVTTSKNHRIYLDFVRGLAAIAVLAGHLRAFYFVDYETIIRPNILDKMFYALTGFGHQSVMVFFVLSGFLIGGTVYEQNLSHRWSWLDYGIKRLSRLWTVLIPALILTAFWDHLGIAVHGNVGYDGTYAKIIHSGPGIEKVIDTGFICFVGNLFHLQNIFVNVYGTNGPIWSLAYEFWYYAMFPLLLLLFVPNTSNSRRVINTILIIAIISVIPKIMSLYGLIWLMGFGAYIVYKNPLFEKVIGSSLYLSLMSSVLILVLMLSRSGHTEIWDFVIGLAFAAVIPCLAKSKSDSTVFVSVSKTISSFSYTLYLVHFPILSFLFFTMYLPDKYQPTLFAYLLYTLFMAFILLYAWSIWFLFEKRTDVVRRWITNFSIRHQNQERASKSI